MEIAPKLSVPRAASTVLPRQGLVPTFPSAAAGIGQSQLSCIHVHRISFPTLPRLHLLQGGRRTKRTFFFPVPVTLQGQRGVELCITLRCQHGPKQQLRPRTSAWPLVVTLAMDIDVDPCCSRIMNPDMALDGSTCQDLTMASGDILVASWASGCLLRGTGYGLSCLSIFLILLIF